MKLIATYLEGKLSTIHRETSTRITTAYTSYEITRIR